MMNDDLRDDFNTEEEEADPELDMLDDEDEMDDLDDEDEMDGFHEEEESY